MEEYIHDMRSSMMLNKLKLNGDKTELILINSRYHSSSPLNFISVREEEIVPTTSVMTVNRNVGVNFYEHVRLEEHIDNICKSAYFHIRNISKIKKYLSRDCLEIIIHAFIFSKLDYCNSLLIGTPKCILQKLQRVQIENTVSLTHKHKALSPYYSSSH